MDVYDKTEQKNFQKSLLADPKQLKGNKEEQFIMKNKIGFDRVQNITSFEFKVIKLHQMILQ